MPTIDRNLERGLRAAERARANGATALDAAKAMIDAAFDPAAAHIDFKAKVAAMLAMGAAHPANKARFAPRGRMLRGKPLDAAAAAVERWYVSQRKAIQIASVFARPVRLELMILTELRLMLRFFRRRGMSAQFPALVETLCEPLPPVRLIAAE
jgi:hypothetical protein